MKALRPRVALAGFAVLAWGCATTATRGPLDLGPARQAVEAARQAVEAARQAGARERAAATFTRAEDRLKDAERLAGTGGTAPLEAARDAEWLGRLALTEAQCEQRTSDA